MTEEAIMLAMALAERYATNMHGVLSCFDRIIITGIRCRVRATRQE